MSKMTKDQKETLYSLIDKLILEDVGNHFRLEVDWRKNKDLKPNVKKVQKPMWLTKVRNKVKMSLYKTNKDCFDEILLIWSNCKTCFKENSVILT